MVMMMMVGVRCERVPGLLEWEAHQRAVLQAENQLLAEAPQTGQTVPGIEQWEAQHRAALAAQDILKQEEQEEPEEEEQITELDKEDEEGSLGPELTTTETLTTSTSTSTSAPQKGQKSILEFSFKRLLSKLKLRQNDKKDQNENDLENSKTNKLSLLLTKKEDESGNSNYLDLLLNSYNQNDKERQREIPRSFRKPSSSFDEELSDNEYYDYHTDTGDGDRQRFSNRFRFLYEDDSDITRALKQSRQLDRSLRRFLSQL